MNPTIYRLNDLDLKPFLTEKYGEQFAEECEVYYHYLITKILYQYIYYGYDHNRGYVELYSEEIKNVMGTKTIEGLGRPRLRKIVVEDLQELNIISWRKDKVAQNKSAVRCKLYVEYYSKGWTKIPDNEVPQKLKSNIIKFRKKYNKTITFTKTQKDLQQIFSSHVIDKKSAIKFINRALTDKIPLRPRRKRFEKFELNRVMNITVADSWKMCVNHFDEGFFAPHKTTGRAYTHLTNLPRPLRRFVMTADGKKMNCEIDIASCQPLLLCHLVFLSENLDKNNLPSDYIFYKSLCESGTLYDTFKSLMKADGYSYNEHTFKADFFENLLFGKFSEKKVSKYRKVFKKHFPTVYRYLERIKKIDYKKVSILLQFLEATIMIERVAAELISLGIKDFYTVHDAIFTTKKNEALVRQIIIKYFAYFELSPMLK